MADSNTNVFVVYPGDDTAWKVTPVADFNAAKNMVAGLQAMGREPVHIFNTMDSILQDEGIRQNALNEMVTLMGYSYRLERDGSHWEDLDNMSSTARQVQHFYEVIFGGDAAQKLWDDAYAIHTAKMEAERERQRLARPDVNITIKNASLV